MRSSRKINKLNIVEFVPSMQLGGAENVARSICQNFDRQKFNLSVVTSYSRREGSWPKDIKYQSLNKQKGIKLRYIGRLKNILNDTKPDIIHSHSLYSLPYIIAANHKAKAKIIQTIHNDLTHYSNETIWLIIFKLFKIIPVNLSSNLNKKIQKLPNNTNIGNGINLKDFEKIKNIRNKKILFIGRLEKQKDPILAVDLLKELSIIDSSYSLTMIGNGHLENNIINHTKELGLLNIIKFIFKKVDPKDYFKTHRYLLMTSAWEGMPLLAIEAMASGMIVFSTQVGAIKSIIKDGKTGFIFKSRDPIMMANQFLTAVDKFDQSILRESVKKKSCEFSENKMVSSYEKLYLKIYNK
jgi:glycosyltransferase involved in cell wall biosynthesis